MSGWLAVLCEISGCEQDPETGVCKRCGRVKRVEEERFPLCNRKCTIYGQSEATTESSPAQHE